MPSKRITFWSAGGLAVLFLVGLAFGYRYLILDLEGKPFCHKQVMMAFITSMHAPEANLANDPQPFPNVNGVGRDSLAMISEGMNGEMEWAKDYKYVPGLREDDPGDLVLMYFDRPTRWVMHISPPTIFNEKAWIVVPLDFAMGSRPPAGPGELSEQISLDEFRSRLRKTLDFIRTNKRPNWQTIVAEHTEFLDSIEHVDQ
jgi:hypothetical protein